jgi:hypothetical protein
MDNLKNMSQHTDGEMNVGVTDMLVGRKRNWLCVMLIMSSRTERKEVDYNFSLK